MEPLQPQHKINCDINGAQWNEFLNKLRGKWFHEVVNWTTSHDLKDIPANPSVGWDLILR